MVRFLPLLALVFSVCIGCSNSPGLRSEPVEKSGTLKLNGAPLNDVVLNLRPTTIDCQPAVATVTEGKFKISAIPGKYCVYITQGKLPASYKAVPEEYREPSLERDELVIDSGTSSIDINLE
jgi:hypothetical protein